MNADGFTYLTDGTFFGRIRGSIEQIHSGTTLNIYCVATKEMRGIPKMHLNEIPKEDAEIGMQNWLSASEMKVRVEAFRIEKMKKLEQEFSLKAQAFQSRQDALLACTILQFVSGREPKLILPMDKDRDGDDNNEEELQSNGQWIVLSNMTVDIALVILMPDLAPPVIRPWWWDEVNAFAWEAKIQYPEPVKLSYLECIAIARTYEICRRSGGEIARDFPIESVDLYWDDAVSNYLQELEEERERYDEE